MDDAEVTGTCHESAPNNVEVNPSQGLEELSLSNSDEGPDDNEGVTVGGETVGGGNEAAGIKLDDETAINNIEDMGKINLKDISLDEIVRYHFPNIDVAFMFYNMYASMHGFAARKSRVLWNRNGEMIQRTFLCHLEGHRVERNNNNGRRKREPKPITRCGCLARCQVHVELGSGRWYIKYFNDSHNHPLMEEKYARMLPAHRKINEMDKSQMSSMREVGIKTPHIYSFLASRAGGYDRVGFLKRDLHTEQQKQSKTQFSDAKAAVDYLDSMWSSDDMLFYSHTVDGEGRLEHLFWCDGVGRSDFSIFGDVLAFDATYRKNKYMCPLVIFSGVNHHNMSVVFASAIVANETEETYVWLLEQFLVAMSGKSPTSVITDGDLAMKNAIRKVFPNAHHRLCAWHLLRNATSNVKNSNFVSRFRHCMLGDFDVEEFNRRWDKLVADFGLEENVWVLELYEKRRMWATAYIRGNFFAGFRTTSRCEGLHSEFGKYVNYRNNLVEFLQHFFRWVGYMRFREIETDFSSLYGEPVLQTQFESLERSAAHLYTKEVFKLFRPLLERACTCNVVGTQRTASRFIYTVCQYCREGYKWHVSFYESSLEFKCTCQKFESLGITCEHVIRVLVHLNIVIIPECVVLKRWIKAAKDSIGVINSNGSTSRDSGLWFLNLGLVEHCKDLVKAAYECGKIEHMRKTIDIVTSRTKTLKCIRRGEIEPGANVDQPIDGSIRDPARVRSKGRRGASSSLQNKAKKMKAVRKPPTCGICGGKGHKRHICPVQRDYSLMAQERVGSSDVYGAGEFVDDEFNFTNTDLGVY